MIDSFTGEYFFLSNFYTVKIKVGVIVYPSVEHAYQASKTLSRAARMKVREAPTAGEAKRLGRELVLRRNWEQIKLGMMKGLLEIKFNSVELKAKLLATGDRELIEGNTWGDRYWGVCGGKGENHLGKLLMEVRASYRS